MLNINTFIFNKFPAFKLSKSIKTKLSKVLKSNMCNGSGQHNNFPTTQKYYEKKRGLHSSSELPFCAICYHN